MPVPFTGQARYDTPLSRVPDKRVPKWRVIFAYPNDQTCQPPCLALLYLEGRAREAVERAAVWYLWSVLQTRQPGSITYGPPDAPETGTSTIRCW